MKTPRTSVLRTLPILMALLALSAGCGKQEQQQTLSGRYVHLASDQNVLELKADGTFTLQQAGMAFTGSYTVDGTTFTLNAPTGSDRGTIRGDTLIDSDGERWVKR